MLKCLIAFILGWLVSRHMGNGFSIGGDTNCVLDDDKFNTMAEKLGMDEGERAIARCMSTHGCSTISPKATGLCEEVPYCKIASE